MHTPSCVVCEALLTQRRTIRLQRAFLLNCHTCGSWTYFPRPDRSLQVAIHDDADYFEHPYFQHRRNNQVRIDDRCRWVMSQINAGVDIRSLQGEQLLDVGCDTGAFLASAKQQFGVCPVGIDVSVRAVQFAKQQGICAYHTDLEHAPADLKNLAVITAIDVIEHVVDPRSLLATIFERLRPGGVTYLETPNIHSNIYRVGRWICNLTGGHPTAVCDRLFPPHHIQYFTPTSFLKLAEECGFEVVRFSLRPLPFVDLGTSLPLRIGLTALQLIDRLAHTEILLCALLRKP